MTEDRLNELLGKAEVSTTDGEMSAFTAEDIGDIYLCLLAQCDVLGKLKDRRRMGQQKDDPEMANDAQALITALLGNT